MGCSARLPKGADLRRVNQAALGMGLLLLPTGCSFTNPGVQDLKVLVEGVALCTD